MFEHDFWDRSRLIGLSFPGNDIPAAEKALAADPETINYIMPGMGFNAFMQAISGGRATPEFLQWLIDHKADILIEDTSGRNIVHCAANAANPTHIEFLRNLDILPAFNSPMHNGNTPLHAVCMQGTSTATMESRKLVVDWLFENGADPNLTNNKGQTPGQLAECQGLGELKKYIKEKERARFNIFYSDVGFKQVVNNLNWPAQFEPLQSLEQAKALVVGFEEQKNMTIRNKLGNDTLEKTRKFYKQEGDTHSWVEINYKRTRGLLV